MLPAHYHPVQIFICLSYFFQITSWLFESMLLSYFESAGIFYMSCLVLVLKLLWVTLLLTLQRTHLAHGVFVYFVLSHANCAQISLQ